MPRAPPHGVKTGPPLPGELLADLLALVGEINAVLDPDELFPAIAQKLRRIVDYRILDIFVPDDRGLPGAGPRRGLRASRSRARFRLRLGEGIVGAAAAPREVVFVPDVSRDPRYVSFFPGVVAELALPLVNQDRLVGVLNIEGPEAAPFTPAARTALQVLASHLAVAIENATLYRETRWYAGLLATLHEIGKETSSILDLDELLQRARRDRAARGRLRDVRHPAARRGAARSWCCARRSTSARPSSAPGSRSARACAAPRFARASRSWWATCGRTRATWAWWPRRARSWSCRCVHKDRVIGVLDLESPQLDRFNERHVKVLTPLASQVAIAIENARLYDEIVKNDERLSRELRIARDIQHALFPESSPRGAGWEASAHFRPARELGGDLYDFYDMGGGLARRRDRGRRRQGGSGRPLRGLRLGCRPRARLRAARRRPICMERVNRTLRRRGIEGLFCTLAYALFDFQERSLRLANSGLPHPFHYRAATGRAQPLDVSGLPLGTFDGVSYDELKAELGGGGFRRLLLGRGDRGASGAGGIRCGAALPAAGGERAPLGDRDRRAPGRRPGRLPRGRNAPRRRHAHRRQDTLDEQVVGIGTERDGITPPLEPVGILMLSRTDQGPLLRTMACVAGADRAPGLGPGAGALFLREERPRGVLGHGRRR